MSRRGRPRKTCWHPLSLQQLSPHKFIPVVNNILSGRYTLVTGIAPTNGDEAGRWLEEPRGDKS